MNFRFSDVQKICRVCLQCVNFKIMVPISLRYMEMIMECTSVRITENDNLPRNICGTCVLILKNSYYFKKLCEKSDRSLQAIVKDYTELNISITEKINENSNHISDSRKIRTEKVLTIENIDCTVLKEENFILSDNIIDIEDKSNSLFESEVLNKKEKIDVNLIKNEKLSNNEETQSENDNASWSSKNNRKIKTDNQLIYACDKCPKKFTKAHRLGTHCQFAHKTNGMKCKTCFLICYHPVHLKEHEQRHTKVKGAKYKCIICNQIFENKINLTEHQSQDHNYNRPFSCDHCNKTFTVKSSLVTHIKTKHTELTDEMRQQLYKICHVCGKSIRLQYFVTHLIVHENIKPVECKYCFKRFKFEISLKAHIRNLHSGSRHYKYLCNICGQGADSPSTLEAHSRRHTGEKPFSCNLCGKRFKSKSNVNGHITFAHLDVRKHICPMCSRGFHSKATLNNHMRTHTGEKPYRCTFCDKTFSFEASWKRHKIKVHP